MPPFVIYSLPRSRSAWLAHWLSSQGLAVGHDLGIECKEVADFKRSFDLGLVGTCETGGMFAWRLVQRELPGVQFVTVRRPVGEVLGSLAAFGLTGEALEAELFRREVWLDELEAQPGTLRLEFSQLGEEGPCRALLARLAPEVPWDHHSWVVAEVTNIQVDMSARLEQLRRNGNALARLKQEAEALEGAASAAVGWSIYSEPWSHIWPEAEALAQQHWEEVDSGVEPRRRFAVDAGLCEKMYQAGVLKCFALRCPQGHLLGYLTWQLMMDPESQGLVVAQQGAWYVAPGHARAARALFLQSLVALRAWGVKCVFPHHRAQGRGRSLGRFFQRLGAKPIQQGYSLWIGE